MNGEEIAQLRAKAKQPLTIQLLDHIDALRAENERLQRERKEINITAQMIEAGVEELRSKSFGMPLEDIVQNVFLMMALEEKS